jgi:hypothetical protein
MSPSTAAYPTVKRFGEPDGRRGMIHSYFNVMKVVETGFADPWPGRVVGSYAYLGLEDVQ